jgi:hypothetical protein
MRPIREVIRFEWRDGETDHPNSAISVLAGRRPSGVVRVFIALHGVEWWCEHFLEATMNLAQFPEDQNKNNHDYE